jgi:putative copper resistance protein D
VGAVLAILVTGAANTALMLGMSRDFIGSIYFRVLTAKLGLVLAMIAVAVINRMAIAPQIARSPQAALRSLRRNVLFEQVLGLGVLAAVSWLGALDPSM